MCGNLPEPVRIRPHHGLCTAFFKGEGYSGDFVKNMSRIVDFLSENDPRIILAKSADEICRECPNLSGGECSGMKASRYDEKVLELCGAAYGAEMSWTEFSQLVRKKIISADLLSEVCGDCIWANICGA